MALVARTCADLLRDGQHMGPKSAEVITVICLSHMCICSAALLMWCLLMFNRKLHSFVLACLHPINQKVISGLLLMYTISRDKIGVASVSLVTNNGLYF